MPFGFVVDLAGLIEGCDGFVVGGDEAGLSVVVPLVSCEWVQQQGQAGCEHENEDNCSDFFIHVSGLSLML